MKLFLALAILSVAVAAHSQPSGMYLRFQGYPDHSYIEVPHSDQLDTPNMTIEAWIAVQDANAAQGGLCSSIVGKNYVSGLWVGICGQTLRSYVNGFVSQRSGGRIPARAVWTHVAVVTDGTTRKHYIDGQLAAQFEESPSASSTDNLRIGSDGPWTYTPRGGIDDLRIWRVARSEAQIRETMRMEFPVSKQWGGDGFSSSWDGLEAWYRFEGDAMDSWKTHHGTVVGAGISFARERTRAVVR